MNQRVPYRLTSAPEIARSARYTYFIPSAEARRAVRVGDLVKLTFEWEPPFEEYEAERMWVEVTCVEDMVYEGKLTNSPFEKDKLQVGDVVCFGPDNIIDIDWSEPGPAVFDPPYREYWDRCLVDACVLDGAEPVEYIYREEPDLAQEGDKYPDSGWRIRGREGDATAEEMDQRKAQYVAIGAVLNRDDSWLHLIDAPVGSRFVRDFETGKYDPA